MNLSSKALIQILEKNGFRFKRSRGSHHIYFNQLSAKTVSVPVHTKDLKKGTFLGILKQANIDKNLID